MVLSIKSKITRLEKGETSGECSHTIVDKWYEVESAEDVFIDILSRLPVKSLLACKCVCKNWCRLISSQAFIELQLIQSRKHPMFIVYPCQDLDMDLYFMKGSNEIMPNISFPYCDNPYEMSIISSVDGLICCVNYPMKYLESAGKIVRNLTDLEVRICNPLTGDVLLLPEATASEERPSIGVAFGPKINEYKVFRIFSTKSKCPAKGKVRPQVSPYLCEVYSSSTGSWSVIGRVSQFPMRNSHDPLGPNHIFVNGKVYWFVALEEDRETPGSILAVDYEGKFETIELPDEVNAHAYMVDLEGCLSLVVVYDDDDAMVVWSLEYCSNAKWKWKWICSDDVPFAETMECVEFIAARNRELFFTTTSDYYIYNLEQKVWETFRFVPESCAPVALNFTQSLLSSKGYLGTRTSDISSGSST